MPADQRLLTPSLCFTPIKMALGLFVLSLFASLLSPVSLSPVAFSQTPSGDEPVFSGPQPGEKLTALNLMGVYDDAAGKEFDPVAQANGKPTLLIFVHKVTRPGLGMTRGLSSYAKSIKEPAAVSVVVWLDEDKANAEAFLKRARQSLNLQVPVGISVDGVEGPGAYGLNRNVELTILIANEGKVVANMALVQPSMTDGVKAAGEFAKLLGKEPPTAEQLQQIAFPGRTMDMRRGDRTPARDAARPADSQKDEQRPATDAGPAKQSS